MQTQMWTTGVTTIALLVLRTGELKSAKYVALPLEIAVIHCINTTLKEFSHTLCDAHDLDLKSKTWVHGS